MEEVKTMKRTIADLKRAPDGSLDIETQDDLLIPHKVEAAEFGFETLKGLEISGTISKIHLAVICLAIGESMIRAKVSTNILRSMMDDARERHADHGEGCNVPKVLEAVEEMVGSMEEAFGTFADGVHPSDAPEDFQKLVETAAATAGSGLTIGDVIRKLFGGSKTEGTLQ